MCRTLWKADAAQIGTKKCIFSSLKKELLWLIVNYYGISFFTIFASCKKKNLNIFTIKPSPSTILQSLYWPSWIRFTNGLWVASSSSSSTREKLQRRHISSSSPVPPSPSPLVYLSIHMYKISFILRGSINQEPGCRGTDQWGDCVTGPAAANNLMTFYRRHKDGKQMWH